MAFKLYKASGARVPDLVSDIGAGATLGASGANIVNGKLVQLVAADGDLEVGATGVAVAGIIAAEYGSTTYASGGSATFPAGVAEGTKIPFLPVTGTVPIIADIAGTVAAGAILPGEDLDITAGGLTLSDASTNDDFHVVKVIDDGTNITQVVGFFNTPGYFTA